MRRKNIFSVCLFFLNSCYIVLFFSSLVLPLSFNSLSLPLPLSFLLLLATHFLGVKKLFVFEGGPLPWPEAPLSFRQALNSSEPAAARIVYDAQAQRTYRVVCATLGHQSLTLEAGNQRSATLPFPRTEKVRMALHCEHPHAIKLEPVLLPAVSPVDIATDECIAHRLLPSVESSVHRVRTGRVLGLRTELWNAEGRPFDNFSTAVIAWTHDLDATFLSPAGDIHAAFVGNLGQVYQLGDKTALATVTAELTGYHVDEVFASPLPRAPPLLGTILERLLLELVHNHDVRLPVAFGDGCLREERGMEGSVCVRRRLRGLGKEEGKILEKERRKKGHTAAVRNKTNTNQEKMRPTRAVAVVFLRFRLGLISQTCLYEKGGTAGADAAKSSCCPSNLDDRQWLWCLLGRYVLSPRR